MCILIYKYRYLADYLLYCENFIQVIAILHLNSTNYNMDFTEVAIR